MSVVSNVASTTISQLGGEAIKQALSYQAPSGSDQVVAEEILHLRREKIKAQHTPINWKLAGGLAALGFLVVALSR